MTLCTITPTRGDRPQLLDFCMKRLIQMNVPHFIIADRPEGTGVDLVGRIQKGIEIAKHHGFDWVFVVEDDDWYPVDYFQKIGELSNLDVVGFSSSLYYNLRNRTYEILKHAGRSSLYCTGFRVSALDNFAWKLLPPSTKFLDIELWNYARDTRKRVKLIEDPVCVGIKGHGIGKAAGKGHLGVYRNQDDNLHFLKTMVDGESFIFYTDLMEKQNLMMNA